MLSHNPVHNLSSQENEALSKMVERKYGTPSFTQWNISNGNCEGVAICGLPEVIFGETISPDQFKYSALREKLAQHKGIRFLGGPRSITESRDEIDIFLKTNNQQKHLNAQMQKSLVVLKVSEDPSLSNYYGLNVNYFSVKKAHQESPLFSWFQTKKEDEVQFERYYVMIAKDHLNSLRDNPSPALSIFRSPAMNAKMNQDQKALSAARY